MTPMTPGLANRSQSMILMYTEKIIDHNQLAIQMYSVHWSVEQGKTVKTHWTQSVLSCTCVTIVLRLLNLWDQWLHQRELYPFSTGIMGFIYHCWDVCVSVKGTLKQNAPFVGNKLYWLTPSGTSRQSGGERLIGRTMSQTSVYSLTRQWLFCKKGYSWSVSVKPSGDSCHAVTPLHPLLPHSVQAGDMHKFKEIKRRKGWSIFNLESCGIWFCYIQWPKKYLHLKMSVIRWLSCFCYN